MPLVEINITATEMIRPAALAECTIKGTAADVASCLLAVMELNPLFMTSLTVAFF